MQMWPYGYGTMNNNPVSSVSGCWGTHMDADSCNNADPVCVAGSCVGDAKRCSVLSDSAIIHNSDSDEVIAIFEDISDILEDVRAKVVEGFKVSHVL